eukprot:1437892-Pyramimonas_sp.AAC.1
MAVLLVMMTAITMTTTAMRRGRLSWRRASVGTGCDLPALSWPSRRWTGDKEDEMEGCDMRRLFVSIS